MASPDPFAAIDESKISRFQYKIMCVSGMGFFTDAEGDPAESLVSAAKDANLLVLGTRGRSRLAGFLLGSVSSRCAAAALCPVLLVKAQQDHAET